MKEQSGSSNTIGIDLGGTKIEVAVLNPQGVVLYRQRTDTPRGDYSATIASVVSLVGAAESWLGNSATVGIATPGALADGKIKNANSVWLNNKPLKSDLESALARPVSVCNDANCFALSESIDGAARDAEVVFGVILGTGTGAGVVVNKKPLTGCNSIAGEWGHNPLPWLDDDDLPVFDCYCGKQGCVETYLSGPGFAKRYNMLTDNQLSAKQIIERVATGDREAHRQLGHYQRRLAKALAAVINILDPDVIVLGGGMSNITSLYQTVPKLWVEYVFSDTVLTQLVPPVHGDSSGVRGAAWL
jgi:predicted NBD/HSP70 family sugar kinase